MPGCLGLDGFWQLIGFFLTWTGGNGKGRALGVKDLKFKGQVRPYHNKITYQIDIKKFITRPTHMVWGEAVLKVKDKAIYFAKDLQAELAAHEIYPWPPRSDSLWRQISVSTVPGLRQPPARLHRTFTIHLGLLKSSILRLLSLPFNGLAVQTSRQSLRFTRVTRVLRAQRPGHPLPPATDKYINLSLIHISEPTRPY